MQKVCHYERRSELSTDYPEAKHKPFACYPLSSASVLT